MPEYPMVSKGVPFIYGIRLTDDPIKEYRYVGLTSRGIKRLKQHVIDARTTTSKAYGTYKSKWMRKYNFDITFDILEELKDESLLASAEVSWIDTLRRDGHRLTNATTGGEGVSGLKHTPDTRRKIGDVHRGKTVSAESRAKMSASRSGEGNHNYGKKFSDETRRKISEGKKGVLHQNYGKHLSAETRAKIGAAQVGQKNHMFGKKATEKSKLSLALGAHSRWHVNRGIVNRDCAYCQALDTT